MGIWRTQQLVKFLREHHWLTYRQYIQPIHPLQYIHSIFTLQYPLHKHLHMVQVTLHHHIMTRQHKLWHLKAILIHATTHPICYRMYHMTRIQVQVCHILLRRVHLTHKMTIILNEDDVQKRIKIKVGVKIVWMTLSKSAQILQPSYSQPRTHQGS